MTEQNEACRVLALIDAAATWKARRTDDELADAVEDLIAMLPACPDGWAVTATRAAIRAGEAPTVATIAATWQAERARRVREAGRGEPPRGAGSGAVYVAWARARHAAVLEGATAAEADAAAAAAVGLKPAAPQPAAVDSPARARALAALAVWRSSREREQAELDAAATSEDVAL